MRNTGIRHSPSGRVSVFALCENAVASLMVVCGKLLQ